VSNLSYNEIKRFPRTQHLQGSRLQKGDEDLTQVRFTDIQGLNIIIEEKMDGANCGISFDSNGKLLLQSRGHFLRGGPRERHWDLFKQWAAGHEQILFDMLEDRYIMYGEWLYAKHTIFYDLLPHYFLEFDIYDKQHNCFLTFPMRKSILHASPVKSVLVLYEGVIQSIDDVIQLITHSYFKTGNWRSRLRAEAIRLGIDDDLVIDQTDSSDQMEGLYIKVEDNFNVKQRLKWVRNSFNNAISDSESHWLDRPIIPNILAPGVDIFSYY
jgi:hypothetical protein